MWLLNLIHMKFELITTDGKLIKGTAQQIIDYLLKHHLEPKPPLYNEEESDRRMKNIGRNGNEGSHYSDSMTGLQYTTD